MDVFSNVRPGTIESMIEHVTVASACDVTERVLATFSFGCHGWSIVTASLGSCF